jgi:probable F420-dependent oxidoreductase
MDFGLHLPASTATVKSEELVRFAQQAEALGFYCLTVADHVIVPKNISVPYPYTVDGKYPSTGYHLETLMTMGYLAGATKRIRFVTSVMILPYRNPLVTAKMLASLDVLYGGRVIVGAGVGWSEAEFEALGYDFADRGARTDEAIEIMRTAWSQDPITRDFPVHGASFSKMRTLPHPTRDIPIWIGGHAPVALRRATRVGDGWHGAFLTAEETAERVRFLRSERPDPAFRISMRTGWDPLLDDHDIILGQLDDLVAAGVTHFVPEPRQRTIDDYLRSIEQLAKLLQSAGLAMDAA